MNPLEQKRQYLLEHGWSEEELFFKRYHRTLSSEAQVVAYHRKILAATDSGVVSKNMLAKILGINEKMIRYLEKKLSTPLTEVIHDAFSTGHSLPTQLPESLRSSEALLDAYGDRTGHLVCYQRVSATDWEVNVDDPLRGAQWTVAHWFAWHSEASAQPPETIDRLYYLVDISLPNHVEEELIKSNPFLALLQDTGPLSLNRYIHALDATITRPHMRSKLYLAPTCVLGGVILTPPHRDGHGTQASIHTHLFGSGYNLVRIWPLDPSQVSYFQKIVGLPPLDQPQHLPHDVAFRYDSSTEKWHTVKDQQLELHGIQALLLKLLPAHMVLLRSGWPHTVKKICELPVDGSAPIPLAGFAGDFSYIGETPDVVIPELFKIVDGHKRLRLFKQDVYCFWQLALWCMVDLYRGDQKLVSIHHLRAALPYIEEMLTEEEESLRELEYDEEDSVVMDDDHRSDEYICSNCKVCLWNLVVVLTQNTPPPPAQKRARRKSSADKSVEVVVVVRPQHLCGPCAIELNKEVDTHRLSVMFRFQPTAQLREQFNQLEV